MKKILSIVALSACFLSSTSQAQAQTYNSPVNWNIANSTIDGTNKVSSVITNCSTLPTDVYIGGDNSISQLVDTSNISSILAGGRTAPYLPVFAVGYLVSGTDAFTTGSVANGTKLIQNFSGASSPGIGEEFYDAYATPSIPAGSHNDGGALASVDGPTLSASIGFKPSIMMMNVNYSTTGQHMSDADVTLFNTAVSDIKTTYPSVKYVFPYIDALSNTHTDWTTPDSWWANTVTLIKNAGGVGIDIPVGIPAYSSDPNMLNSIINEIKWANANGIATVVLLTPYAQNPPSGVLGQFAYDSNFLVNTKWVIGKLQSNNALPSAWVVSNYDSYFAGETTHSNYIGNDNDLITASVASVSRWVSENAPTSSYVHLPSSTVTNNSSVCAKTVLNGLNGTNTSLGSDHLGLGSLAYQSADSARVGALEVDNGLTVTYGDLYLKSTSNLDITSGKSIAFGFGKTPAYLGDDGSGNIESKASFKFDQNINVTGKACLDSSCTRYVYESNSKVYIGNTTNGNVASIDDSGNLILKGTLTQSSTP